MSTLNNQPLPKTLRTQLENTVKAARDVAEVAATAALTQLAVGEGKAPDYLTEDQKALRRRLRAHGRALGDVKASDDSQSIRHLVWETAYEHWHRMLFARFLAENGLLLWEPGAPVTLAECEEMVQDPATSLGAKSGWDLAGKLAARMLPQVFKPQHPVFDIAFAIEHQRKLETLLAALPEEVFEASDSLGWVYQFWQAKRKQEVNDSEVKIGADELSAVTQLFTEPYMVDFLLHNSLGAWWTTRHPGKTCPVPLTYLRTLDDGTPAAGKFEGWPDTLTEFKLLDPCCGSGHFLVAAFLLLVPMRMAVEGLTAVNAVDLVLQDNLHGLELDARCVEIAVFALALAAWRFPDENGDPLGVRSDMPAPHIACCGLKVAAKPDDWMGLVPDDAANAAYLRQELRLLHGSFVQAPVLGSLLDPSRSLKNDLATSSFDTLRELLVRALATERPATLWGQTNELQDDSWDLAFTAKGLLDAARLLDARYHHVITNVPFLNQSKYSTQLKHHIYQYFDIAKENLASTFALRMFDFLKAGGTMAFVAPQSWWFLKRYANFRHWLLKHKSTGYLVRLGDRAFEVQCGELVGLSFLENKAPEASGSYRFLDASEGRGPQDKATLLITQPDDAVPYTAAMGDGDFAFHSTVRSTSKKIGDFASALQGCVTGDSAYYLGKYWERPRNSGQWEFLQSTSDETRPYGGMTDVILWENEKGALAQLAAFVKGRNHSAQNWRKGKPNWGKQGVVVSQMGDFPATIYQGNIYDHNCCAIVPNDPSILNALWAYCSSGDFAASVKKLNQNRKVEVGTLLSTEFSLDYWQKVSAERYPDGLPKPYSDDPTQWLFHGHPQPGTDPLQIAVARLVGYRWPAETDKAMELADEARTWIARGVKLAEYADDDGIVCLPSVRGEEPAHDRLLKLLIAAWETVQPGSWKPAVLNKLLADADCAGKDLHVWLREKFFEQHAKRFHHRPFIWHVWDGLKDGFAALVNYHKLDTKNLERLIHTYLGDWIRQQEGGVRDGVDGASTRLAAALDLKRRLELILEGEKPYDIFVRWKPLAEHSIGWNPDLNDGVRMNIRPFMIAEVLRHNKKPKLNITWDKDRGKDVESAPWFKVHKGDRINDYHLSLADKKANK